MKKRIIGLLLIILCQFSYSEVFIKIYEPIRFNVHNTRAVSSNTLIGEGIIEIYTDNEIEDLGKKIVFRFPETGTMSNKKKHIRVKKYSLEKKEDFMIITKKRELVKVYAFLDKNQFLNSKDTSLIEGEYKGDVPIILSLYKKK